MSILDIGMRVGHSWLHLMLQIRHAQAQPPINVYHVLYKLNWAIVLPTHKFQDDAECASMFET